MSKKLITNMTKIHFLKTFQSTFAASLCIVMILSATSLAQSVVITPEKVTYNRLKPKTDSKKTFEIIYPRVKATTTELSEKIQDILNYEKIFPDLNIQEEINKNDAVTEANYEINYNKNNILVINLWYTIVLAYPRSFSSTIVVDLEKGKQINPPDIFTNLKGLASLIQKAQKADIKRTQERYKLDAEAKDYFKKEYYKNAHITVKDLENFSINDKGVTFSYDFNFPHAAVGYQPDGKYFFTWAQLKPYIKRKSMFQNFVSNDK